MKKKIDRYEKHQKKEEVKAEEDEEEEKYCWTHGYKGHNSDECNERADGHRPEATASNTLGGCLDRRRRHRK